MTRSTFCSRKTAVCCVFILITCVAVVVYRSKGVYRSIYDFQISKKKISVDDPLIQRFPTPLVLPPCQLQLHVIMSFPVLTKDSIKTGSYSRATPKLIEERMSEFVTGLQRTLNHPCVYRVYFLYNELHVVDYVKTHIHVDLDKMSFHLVKNPRSHVGLFDFAYENLQGQIAIYTPADVYLGEGFELIKKDVLAANKLIYIMSRHSRQEKYCDMRRDITSTSCTDKKYFGSHDTYVFVPKGKFPKKVRDYLTVPSQDYGVENMSIWAFRTLGNFTVTNPCKVLKVYHLHCTGLRDAKRRRLNTEKDTGKAWPTDQLGIV